LLAKSHPNKWAASAFPHLLAMMRRQSSPTILHRPLGLFCLMARKPHSFCTYLHVKNTFPLNFRLKDNTCVTVSIVSKNSYDFDILLPNGSRRTFRWRSDSPHTLFNRLGQVDEMMKETVEYFLRKLPKR